MSCLRACFNKIFILAIIIVGLGIYLFWKYPPWFQDLVELVVK